jgi:hypothetical protein
MLQEGQEYTLCLFCEVLSKVNSKTNVINEVLENVQKKIGELQGVGRQDVNEAGAEACEKKSDVICRVEELEEKIAGVESKIDESECFKMVRKGSKIKACAKYNGVVTSNAFQVLEDEVSDEPSLMLVGDSLIRHQDEEFCKKGPRRRHFVIQERRSRT